MMKNIKNIIKYFQRNHINIGYFIIFVLLIGFICFPTQIANITGTNRATVEKYIFGKDYYTKLDDNQKNELKKMLNKFSSEDWENYAKASGISRDTIFGLTSCARKEGVSLDSKDLDDKIEGLIDKIKSKTDKTSETTKKGENSND